MRHRRWHGGSLIIEKTASTICTATSDIFLVSQGRVVISFIFSTASPRFPLNDSADEPRSRLLIAVVCSVSSTNSANNSITRLRRGQMGNHLRRSALSSQRPATRRCPSSSDLPSFPRLFLFFFKHERVAFPVYNTSSDCSLPGEAVSSMQILI